MSYRACSEVPCSSSFRICSPTSREVIPFSTALLIVEVCVNSTFYESQCGVYSYEQFGYAADFSFVVSELTIKCVPIFFPQATVPVAVGVVFIIVVSIAIRLIVRKLPVGTSRDAVSTQTESSMFSKSFQRQCHHHSLIPLLLCDIPDDQECMVPQVARTSCE